MLQFFAACCGMKHIVQSAANITTAPFELYIADFCFAGKLLMGLMSCIHAALFAILLADASACCGLTALHDLAVLFSCNVLHPTNVVNKKLSAFIGLNPTFPFGRDLNAFKQHLTTSKCCCPQQLLALGTTYIVELGCVTNIHILS